MIEITSANDVVALSFDEVTSKMIFEIVTLSQNLHLKVLYDMVAKGLILQSEHGINSGLLEARYAHLECVCKMLNFISSEKNLSDRVINDVKTTSSEKAIVELGSSEWLKNMQKRAVIMGNLLRFGHEEGRICYRRTHSISKSPFVLENAFKPKHRHNMSNWYFSSDTEEAFILQCFIEHDEKIYAAWIEAGKPHTDKQRIVLPTELSDE